MARGAAINLGGTLAGKVLTLGYAILLTWVLTPGEVGLYYLALTLFQLVTAASLLGWDSAVLRFVPIFSARGDLARMNGTVRLALRIAVGLGVVCAFAMALFSGAIAEQVFRAPGFRPVVLAFAPAVPFYVAASVHLAATQALGQMQYQVYVRQIAEPVVKLVLTVAVLLAGVRASGVAAAFTVGTILAAVLARQLQARAYGGPRRPSTLPSEWREMLTFSMPQTFSWFLVLLLMWTDTLVLGALGTEEQVGLYSIASRTAIMGMIFLDAFGVMFAPMISASLERGARDELHASFKSISRWGFTLSLPVLLIFLVLPREVLGVYGESYQAAASCLVLLAGCQIMNAFMGPAGQMIVMSGRAWLNAGNILCVAALNLALCWQLVPRLGIEGAAAATLASIMLLHLWRFLELRTLMGITPLQARLWKPAAAGGIAAFVGWGMERSLAALPGFAVLVAGSVALGVAYAGAMMLFGFDADDRLILARVRAKWASMHG